MEVEEIDKIDLAQFNLYKEQRITNFKKAFDGLIAANKSAYENLRGKEGYIGRQKKYCKQDIVRIVEYGTAIEKAALSEHFFKTSGTYKRIVLHYATFLTYSWILVPHMKKLTSKISEKSNAKVYYAAADFCSTFQIERKCTLFAKDIFVKGAYYGLIHDNGHNVVIQDLPFEYCRSRFKNLQDIDIVEFNVKFFDSIRDESLRKEILKTYPKFIQKSYYAYVNRGKENWVFLPAEMGIYFCYFDEKPFFLDLIPLLDDLDDYKEIDKTRNLQALEKIFVQKVLTDSKGLLFEPEEAAVMHDGVVSMLSANEKMDVVTTYNDVQLLDLATSDDERTEIEDVQKLIYQSAGLSPELFYATTEAGLEYSINNDLSMMMILGQQFAHFYSELLNYKYANSKMKFELLILPLSNYNSKVYTTRAKELATLGYSFFTPILSTGLNQNNLADLKELENELLNLDDILKPLQTSYTQSGKNPPQETADELDTVEEPVDEIQEDGVTGEDDNDEEE